MEDLAEEKLAVKLESVWGGRTGTYYSHPILPLGRTSGPRESLGSDLLKVIQIESEDTLQKDR